MRGGIGPGRDGGLERGGGALERKLGSGRVEGAGTGLVANGAGIKGTPRRASSAASLRSLWVFQQVGHRHSTVNVPLGNRARVRRQPNWELMSV
jgi:hypothetical protein